MVAALIILFLICYLLSRWSSGFTKKMRNFLVINVAAMILYNAIIWGCVSIYWRGGEDILPAFFDIVLTVLHLVVLLIVIVTATVREQNRAAKADK